MVRITGHEPQYRTFPSRKEAKDWVRDTEKDIEEQTVTNPKIKIADLIKKYEKEIAPLRKMADSHLGHDIPSIKRVFANMRMSDLQGRGLIEWVRDQKTHPSTQYWHIARLCGVLRQAEGHWNVAVPWRDIRKAKDQMFELGLLCLPAERDRRVTDEELTAIKAQISRQSTTRPGDVFDFCVASAMRIAEVCRITWADLNTNDRTVVIRDRKHPKKKFGNHQVVPLLNGAFEIIERQPKVDARIFPRATTYISKLFRQAADKANLDDVVLHDLRHEGISRLFELGFEIQEVALVSGHTNWRTLRRYTHLRPASLVVKERRLRELLAA